jgi:Ion channel
MRARWPKKDWPFAAPGVWGALYLALVPLFGVIFWALPAGSFYDANLAREPAVPADAAKVLSLLTRDARQADGSTTWGSRPHLELLRQSIVADELNPNVAPRILVHVRADSNAPANGQLLFGTLGEWLEIETDGHVTTAPSHGPVRIGFPALLRQRDGSTTTRGPLDPPLSVLLGQPVGYLGFPSQLPTGAPSAGLWFMQTHTARRLVRLQAALAGEPLHASQSWLRMTYLSVVTVTTLGFGDITPVSSNARLGRGCRGYRGRNLCGAVSQRSRTSPV